MASGITGSWIFTFPTGKQHRVDFTRPTHVVYQGTTTIVFWSDDSKTIVRCGKLDEYDREVAVAMAIAHKIFGSKSKFKKFVGKGHETMSVEDEQIRDAVKAKKKLAKQDEENGSVSF